MCSSDLTLFLFTDAPEEFPDTVAGCPLHKYFVTRRRFSGDTLYRYHYMLKAEAKLREHDFMYYMDVDYWIKESPDPRVMMPQNKGLVATAHFHELIEEWHNGHMGTPDDNPHSKAYIAPGEVMTNYYAGGVQGGGH